MHYPKFLPIFWNKYDELVRKLASNIIRSNIQLDRIIGISRCGLTLGHVLSDLLQLPVSILGLKSYVDIQKQGYMQITQRLGTVIKNENILLVDGIADSGKTLTFATQVLKRCKPCSISTATLFLKPYSTVRPTFYVKQTDRWILFPYETTEWITTFIRQMKKEHKSSKSIRDFLLNTGFTKEQQIFVYRHHFRKDHTR